MNLYITVFLLDLLYQVIASQQECLVELQTIQILSTLSPELLLTVSIPYLYYSGKGNQQFGLYDQCLRDGYHYSSTIFLPDIGGTLYYGICHSNKCESEDLMSQPAQKIIKDMLEVSGIPAMFGMDIQKSTLNFIDPNSYYPELGIGTYLTSTLLIILILLVVMDPIANLFENKNKKKDQSSIEDIEVQEEKKKQNSSILKDFSISKNAKELFNLKTQDPNLSIFSGIRAFAFLMVIFGHTNQMIAGSTQQLQLYRITKKWLYLILFDQLYSVDIFFWLGGFFLGFIMCESKKSKGIRQAPFTIFFAILHRLLRIWPCYIVAMMINSYLAPYLGSGPRWFSSIPNFECDCGAWRNLLFIDNFFEDFKLCFGWGWYLTCDFQMFLACLIPIFIYCLNYRVTAKILIVFMLIACLGVCVFLSFHYHLKILSVALFNVDSYYKFYVKPYARAPPYLLGLLLGILYREFKQSKQNNQRSFLTQFHEFSKLTYGRYVLQILCYGLGGTIVGWLWFGWKKTNENPEYWDDWFQELDHAFCRTLFVFGLSLIAIVNMVGVKDIFNTQFMNCKLLRFIAKISYTAYLVHLIVVLITNGTFYQSPEFTFRSNFYMFIGNTAITIFFASGLTLLVEMPFSKLENRIMNAIAKPQKKENILLGKIQ